MNDLEKSKIKANVNELLFKTSSTKTDLAKFIGITRQNLDRMLDSGDVKLSYLNKIASFFNTSVSFLLGENDTVVKSEQQETVSMPKKIYDFMMSEFDRYRKREDENKLILSKLDSLERSNFGISAGGSLGKNNGALALNDVKLHFSKIGKN